MIRILLTRRWVVLTLVFAALVPVLGELGVWQFHRYQQTSRSDRIINANVSAPVVPFASLAIQWWLFALLVLVAWWTLLRRDLRDHAGDGGTAPGRAPAKKITVDEYLAQQRAATDAAKAGSDR
ncbi:hypothetical protein ABUW04_21575 [Streptacidiphilus sp. N1-10]|uniref:SURF1-like protein n=1 Tax=Streptacidiphilus jeojiensis TaxID=3229225 RepID=A0ABV6XRH4_9ACTN